MTLITTLRRLVPKRLQDFTASLIGVKALQERLERTEARLDDLGKLQSRHRELQIFLDNSELLWDVSRRVWANAGPGEGLTWGFTLTGDAFIEKAESHGLFGESKRVLEIGPGYGRLLKSLLKREVPLGSYLGVDLSEQNVTHLRETFGTSNAGDEPAQRAKRIEFLQAEVERVDLSGEPVDAVYSSLTLKHLYPTFERALGNVAGAANRGCLLCFDLIEGTARTFGPDGTTFIRHYTRDEVANILDRLALELVCFDTVKHDEQHERLLVVARKP